MFVRSSGGFSGPFSGEQPHRLLSRQKSQTASKYDFVKVKVWLGDNLDHYYVLSRFLISRMLTVTKIPYMKAVKIALEVKKYLVDNNHLDIDQAHFEDIIFNIMQSKGFGEEYIRRYKMVTTFYQQRRPLVIMICGAPCTGKSTLAQQLASRLNLPNVIQTDLIYELLRTTEDDPLQRRPLWARSDLSCEQLVAEFQRECRIVRKGLDGDLCKTIRDGKSIIMEGLHLDPGLYLYEFGRYGMAHLVEQRAAAALPRRSKTEESEPEASAPDMQRGTDPAVTHKKAESSPKKELLRVRSFNDVAFMLQKSAIDTPARPVAGERSPVRSVSSSGISFMRTMLDSSGRMQPKLATCSEAEQASFPVPGLQKPATRGQLKLSVSLPSAPAHARPHSSVVSTELLPESPGSNYLQQLQMARLAAMQLSNGSSEPPAEQPVSSLTSSAAHAPGLLPRAGSSGSPPHAAASSAGLPADSDREVQGKATSKQPGGSQDADAQVNIPGQLPADDALQEAAHVVQPSSGAPDSAPQQVPFERTSASRPPPVPLHVQLNQQLAASAAAEAAAQLPPVGQPGFRRRSGSVGQPYAAGQGSKDSARSSANGLPVQSSGHAAAGKSSAVQPSAGPVFVPIVLAMDEADHALLVEEMFARQQLCAVDAACGPLPPGPCPSPEPRCVEDSSEEEWRGAVARCACLQEHLCAYAARGVPVFRLDISAFHETLDRLHDYLLQCIELAMEFG